MVVVALIIFGMAVPFVLTVAVAARVSRRRFPTVWTLAAPVVFAAAVVCLSRLIEFASGGRTHTKIGIAVVIASLAATPALWKLTRRWWIVALAPLAACSASVWFAFFEQRTHGPWYIQSEGVAILLSIGSSAALWHVAMATVLIAWTVREGRRARRLQQDRCLGCGYDLTGLRAAGKCPECGREFATAGGKP